MDDIEDNIATFLVNKDQPNEEEQSSIISKIISLICVDQQEVMFHDFQDPLGSLLQASENVEFILFTKTGFGIRFHFEFPFTQSSFMPGGSEYKHQSGIHLLDWLHWTFNFT